MLNCSDFQVYLGDAIDRFLPKHLEQRFHSHLEACIKCRNEFELEMLSKRIVKSNIARVSTPPHVYTSVVSSLRKEYEISEGTAEAWFERIFGARPWLPVVAGSLAVAVFLMFLGMPRKVDDQLSVHTASNDVMNQAFKNFALIRSGELKPSLVSCFPDSVHDYFHKSSIKFTVNILPMPDCQWYGAISSEYGGVPLAHVVYKLENDIVYVYQVSFSEAIGGSRLALPPAAEAALKQSGWYTDPHHPYCNVVLWTVNGTLCSAVSTMKKEKLLAMVTAR